MTDSILPVEEPVGRPWYLVGPTAYKDNEQEFKKFDFDEEFDRPPFTVTSQEYEVDNKGNIQRDRKGNPKWAKPVIEQRQANPACLEKINENPNHIVLIADWTTFTNCKAWLANAGRLIYQDFKEFSVKEVKQFLALYILQGLSPSLQMKMKFKPQHEDLVNGNDLCHKIFGRNGDRRHEMFKPFFSCQDPRKPEPPQKTHPNFKVDTFLAHLQRCSIEAWIVGR